MKILNNQAQETLKKYTWIFFPPIYIPFAFYKLMKEKEEKRPLKIKGNAGRKTNWY